MKHLLLIAIFALVGCKAAMKSGDKSYFDPDHTPFLEMPAKVVVTPTNHTYNSVTLVWGHNSNVDSYTVNYRLHNATTWSVLTTNGTSPYVVSNLSANTMYDFIIVAKNQLGQVFSDMISTTTLSSANAPVGSTVSVASFDEGVQAIIDLPYAVSGPDLATSCEVINLNKVHVTRACQCDVAGDCSVGVTSNSQTFGAGSFQYRIKVFSLASGYETVSFNINPINDAPTIGTIANIVTSEDTLTNIAFTVNDPDSTILCNSSYLSLTSTNSTLVNPGLVTFSGTYPNCTANLTPGLDLSGTSNLAITVTDGALSATSNTFSLTVNAVNDLPVIGTIGTVATDANVPKTVAFTVTDVDSTILCGNSTITSSNTSLVDATSVVFSGTAPACSMVITPKLNQYGQAVVTLNVTDGTVTSQIPFTINIAQVNIAPTISFISNATTLEGTSSVINFTINDIDSVLACNASHLSMISTNTALVLSTDVSFGGTYPNCTATIHPLVNMFGSTTLTFSVNDGALSTASNGFTLNVSYVDDAPTISTVTTPQVTNQDTVKNVAFTINDIDSTSLTCADVTATSSDTNLVTNSGILITGVAQICNAAITPVTGKSGSTDISFTVNDGTSGNTTSFSLIVNAVNAQPTISAISNLVTSEDTADVVSFTINDPDSTLTCSASHLVANSSNPLVVLAIDVVFGGTYPSCTATISPLANVSGTTNLTITVTDGTLSLTSNPFTVTVNAVNDAPMISTILTPQVTNQDTPKIVTFSISDIDSPIACSQVSGASSDTVIVPNANIVISGTGHNCIATITPASGKNGPVDITLTVNDNTDSSSSAFSLVIVAVNSAPTISGVSATTVAEDTPAVINFTIGDNDSILTCTSSNISATSSLQSLVPLSNIVFSGTYPSCTATITPAADQYGTSNINISVTDGTITTPAGAVAITVTPVNDAPTFGVIAGQTMNQDTVKIINFTINDVDGGLTCTTDVSGTSSDTTVIANAGIVIGGSYPNCTATITPITGKHGTPTITLTVNDGTIPVVTSFPVAIAAVNAAPSISGLSGATTAEDTPLAVNFTINDPDSTLTCTSANLSATSSNAALALSMDVVFSGTYPSCTATIYPLANQYGSTNVTISVTDGTLSYSALPIIINVSSVNDAPTISSITGQAMNQDTVKGVNFSIHDVDSSINCASHVQGTSSNTSIVPNANIFISGNYPDCTATVTPLAGKNGSLNISLQVTDGALTNTSSFSLAIAAVNIPPTLSNIVTPTMSEDTPGTVTFTINDPDSNLDCVAAFVSASSTNSALIDPTQVVIGGTYPDCSATFTPVANISGSATIRILVTDGTVTTTSGPVTLNVAAVNDAPTIASISTLNLSLNQVGTTNVVIGDVDSTLVCSTALSATSSNTALVLGTSVVFTGTYPNCLATITPLHNQSGATNITVTVNDGSLTSAATFAVTFGSTYIPPVAASLTPASISEDTQGVVTLSYTNVQSDLATSCFVASTNHVTVSTPCTCDVAGVCTVGVKGTSDYNGLAGFTYNVTANNTVSNNATASFSILAVNDAPVMGSILSQTTNEDTAKVVNFTVSDVDSTLTCSGSVSGVSSDTTIVASSSIVITGSIPNCIATITPVANHNGTTNITLTATDGTLTSASTFALVVAAVNDAPVMGAISAQTTAEDTQLEVDFSINDIDSTLSCMGNVTGSSSNTAIVANSGIIISGSYPACKAYVTPVANAVGSASITLTVNDGSLSDSKTFSVSVTAVNDAPTISSIAAQSTNEDTVKIVNFTIADVDSTLSCATSVASSSTNTSLVGSGNISISGTAPNCAATITPISNASGSTDITLTVTDGALSNLVTFKLTVNPVNDAPTIPAIAAQTTAEDTAKIVNFTLNDIDSTLLCNSSVTATSSNDAIVLGSNVVFDGNYPNCTATITPEQDMTGTVSLTFTATDGSLTGTQTFSFTVTPVNDAPVISTIAAQSTNEDSALTVNFTITDLDSTLTCAGSVTPASSNTTMIPTNNIVITGNAPSCVATVTPGVDQFGSANITLTVNDGTLSSASTFAMMIAPINDAPTMAAIAAQTTNEDTSKIVYFTIHDVDTSVTCSGSVASASSDSSLVKTSSIVFGGSYPNCSATISPEADVSGTASLTFTVNDGALTASQTFNFIISAVNDAPLISSISAQSTPEDTAKGVSFTISDIDSSLTCSGSVSATSSNTTLIPNANISVTGTAPACTVTVTPAADQNGTGNVTLAVTDGSLTSQSTFALVVTPVNDAPTIPAIVAQTTNEDTAKIVNFTINDIDSTITCSGSVTAATADATLITTSNIVFGGSYPNCTATITPESNVSGTVGLTFTVSDGSLTAVQNFNMVITAVNDAPTITTVAAQVTDEDTYIDVPFTIADIDSTITCTGSVTATSSNTALVANNNVVISGSGTSCVARVTPLTNMSGAAVITLAVTDTQWSRQTSFALTVNAVNDAPTIGFISNDNFDEDSTKTINFTIGDVDSSIACNSSSLSVTSSNSALILATDIVFGGTYPNCTAKFTSLANQNGSTNITISATDGSLTTASNIFIMTVNPVNDAPTMSTISAQSTLEDTSKGVNFTINDIDSTLTCAGSVAGTSSNTAMVANANISVAGTYPNCTATILPSTNMNGSVNITLTVSDGQMSTATTFGLTITPVNDAPTISNIAAQATLEDVPVAVNFTIDDIDSVLTCSGRVSGTSTNTGIVGPSNIVATGTYPNCTATITPVANANGSVTVTLTVTDGALSANTSFALIVTAVDDAPVTSAIASTTLTEDVQSIITLPYTDVENDQATACFVTDLSHVTISQNCACASGVCTVGVKGTQDYNGAAGFSFNVTANGAVSNTTVAAFTITAVNDAPTISSISTQTTNEDTALVVNFTIADVDSAITCASRVTGASSNTTIVPNSYIVIAGAAQACTATITPALNQNGSGTVITLTVTDGALSTPTTFTFNVTPVDDAPVASNITSLTINEDTQATVTLPYIDVDGDQATTCSLSALNHITVTSACSCTAGVCTAGITGTQDYNGVAGFSFNVTANSVVSNTATASFTIAAVNDAPTISAITSKTMLEDGSLSVTFTIADVDSTLTCAGSVTKTSNVTGKVASGNIIVSGTAPNCTAVISPVANANGVVTVTLTVTDTLLTAASSFTLTIQPVLDISGSLTLSGVADRTYARTTSFANITVDEAVTKAELCISEDTNVDGTVSAGEKCNTQTWLDVTTAIVASGSTTPASWSNYTITNNVNGASFSQNLVASCSTNKVYFTHLRLTNSNSNTTELASVSWKFWNPSCVAASIGGWLDASDYNTLFSVNNCTGAVTSGTAAGVKCWKDKSSSNLLYNATGVGFPKYVANAWNGSRPAVVFDGSQDIYATGSLNPKNIFAAVKVLTNENNDVLFGNMGTDFGVRINGSGSWYSSTTSYGTSDFTFANGTSYINGTSGAAHNLQEHILYQSKGNWGLPLGGTWVNTQIGGSALAGGRIHANLAEMIVCTTDCSASRTLFEGYLAHKWGMEANLPANHIYKNTPP